MARVVAALLLLLFGSASLATAQFRPDRIHVSEGVMQALLIKKVDPQNPRTLYVCGAKWS